MEKTRNLFQEKKGSLFPNKILLTLFIGMFLLTFVTAEPKYIGTQYEDIIITETCVVKGFPCPSDFLCNITIKDPSLDVLVLNSPMTRNDTMYNYTFMSTDLLGDYEYNVFCSNVTWSGNQEETLRVTTTGRSINQTFVIVILIIAFGLFLIALWIKNHAVGFISGVLMTISGINIFIYGLTYLNDMYTRSIAMVVLGFGLFIILVAGLEWFSDLEGE